MATRFVIYYDICSEKTETQEKGGFIWMLNLSNHETLFQTATTAEGSTAEHQKLLLSTTDIPEMVDVFLYILY